MRWWGERASASPFHWLISIFTCKTLLSLQRCLNSWIHTSTSKYIIRVYNYISLHITFIRPSAYHFTLVSSHWPSFSQRVASCLVCVCRSCSQFMVRFFQLLLPDLKCKYFWSTKMIHHSNYAALNLNWTSFFNVYPFIQFGFDWMNMSSCWCLNRQKPKSQPITSKSEIEISKRKWIFRPEIDGMHIMLRFIKHPWRCNTMRVYKRVIKKRKDDSDKIVKNGNKTKKKMIILSWNYFYEKCHWHYYQQ